MRHWVKKWKFVGSIPYRVIGIFHYLNPSGRSMGLGSNRVIREMITRGLLGVGLSYLVRRVENRRKYSSLNLLEL